MKCPLKGIKILDFSIAVAGPLGAMMLSDMGAKVIKVERTQGEPMRMGLPAGMDNHLDVQINDKIKDGSWIALNRGKKDLAIDIRKKKGKEIIMQMIPDIDVIIESFRPGVMKRLGLGYGSLKKINPNLIFCSFSGYGDTGPIAHRAGGDMWSQAMSGMVSAMGNLGDAPQMATFGPVDHASGIMIAYAVLLALFVRERTGEGQEICLNNLNAALYLQFSAFGKYLVNNEMPYKVGRGMFGTVPPFGPIRAKDGDMMTIFGTDPLWPEFCRITGIEHLAHDPKFENDIVRYKNRKEIGKILDNVFSNKTRAEWQQIFKKAKMRCDPCLTYEEICAHPQVLANEMIFSTTHPQFGETRMLGVPIKLKKTPCRPRGPSPLLGQHTYEILYGLGYTSDQINKLELEGIIKTIDNKEKFE